SHPLRLALRFGRSTSRPSFRDLASRSPPRRGHTRHRSTPPGLRPPSYNDSPFGLGESPATRSRHSPVFDLGHAFRRPLARLGFPRALAPGTSLASHHPEAHRIRFADVGSPLTTGSPGLVAWLVPALRARTRPCSPSACSVLR